MDLQTPTTAAAATTTNSPPPLPDEADSACSTPYVSAPSSPGHNQPISGFYYSAPTSPMHFSFSSSSSNNQSFEFEFSAKFNSTKPKELSDSTTMSSADELFLDGKIRPMKLSTHLQTPQVLAPLLELSNEDRGRELRTTRDGRIRRTRSMSPMRNLDFEWNDNNDMHGHADEKSDQACNLEEATAVSASSSAGRSSSKRWVFLKDFLRSKSEGRSNNKFWSSITFSPAKEKKCCANPTSVGPPKKMGNGKVGNGSGKRRVPPSAHELHYTANRAQAEEMRKKTYLPYRQGLLGCLGFSSKGYGAVNGFARALNPVSSR